MKIKNSVTDFAPSLLFLFFCIQNALAGDGRVEFADVVTAKIEEKEQLNFNEKDYQIKCDPSIAIDQKNKSLITIKISFEMASLLSKERIQFRLNSTFKIALSEGGKGVVIRNYSGDVSTFGDGWHSAIKLTESADKPSKVEIWTALSRGKMLSKNLKFPALSSPGRENSKVVYASEEDSVLFVNLGSVMFDVE